jgi:hypothetical protein
MKTAIVAVAAAVFTAVDPMRKNGPTSSIAAARIGRKRRLVQGLAELGYAVELVPQPI